MQALDNIKQWHQALPPRDAMLVSVTSVIVLITLFYVALWSPIHQSLDEETQKHQSQEKILTWMQNAALEASALKANGSGTKIKLNNKPVTLVLEQTLQTSGLKTFTSKLESSANNGARLKLEGASFNQVLVWLNTIATHNGIVVTSANIDRGSKAGKIDARLSLSRP